MTSRVVPTQGALSATLAELRSVRTMLPVAAMLILWAFMAWNDLDERSPRAALSSAVLGVVLAGLILHRAVRTRRGLPGPSWVAVPVTAVAMVAMYVAVNAIQPVISARAIAVSVGGTVVILAGFTVAELLSDRRRARATTAMP